MHPSVRTRRQVQEEWFDSLSRSEIFPCVLDALNLEDVGRLMSCSRFLCGAVGGCKDWARAVRELAEKNGLNMCHYCGKAVAADFLSSPDQDLCGCEDNADIDEFSYQYHDIQYHNDWLFDYDPRVGHADFSLKPAHEQFSLLFVFQRMCVTNLMGLYDLDDLTREEWSGWNPWSTDDVFDALPPAEQAREQAWRHLQNVYTQCPSRFSVYCNLTEIAMASDELVGGGSHIFWNVFKGSLSDFDTESSSSVFDTLRAMETDRHLFTIARDLGVSLCSDENFQAYIDDCMKPHITGLGEAMSDLVSPMGKMRANFPRIAQRLEPLP